MAFVGTASVKTVWFSFGHGQLPRLALWVRQWLQEFRKGRDARQILLAARRPESLSPHLLDDVGMEFVPPERAVASGAYHKPMIRARG